MTQLMDAPITWRSFFRATLIFAAEYAMLALIEEAPSFLKVSTIICALALLAALELEDWLQRVRPNAFRSAILLSVTLYSGCIMYALLMLANKTYVKEHLGELYTQGMSVGVREELTVKDDVSEKQIDDLSQSAHA